MTTLTELYEQVLGRPPDDEGYAYWAKEFGPTIEPDEIQTFLGGAVASGEAKNTAELEPAAAKFESSVIRDYVDGLVSIGGTAADIKGALDLYGVTPQELAAAYGANTQEIQQIYNTTVASAPERILQLESQYASTQTTVPTNIELTPEFVAQQKAEDQAKALVKSTYETVLGRTPTPTDPGYMYWVSEVMSGASTPDNIAQNIAFGAQGTGDQTAANTYLQQEVFQVPTEQATVEIPEMPLTITSQINGKEILNPELVNKVTKELQQQYDFLKQDGYKYRNDNVAELTNIFYAQAAKLVATGVTSIYDVGTVTEKVDDPTLPETRAQHQAGGGDVTRTYLINKKTGEKIPEVGLSGNWRDLEVTRNTFKFGQPLEVIDRANGAYQRYDFDTSVEGMADYGIMFKDGIPIFFPAWKDTASNLGPITAIANIAAIATGNAWAVPIISGGSVALQGGDLGDVLEAAAKSYIAQQVGQAVGEAVGSYATEAATAAEYGLEMGSEQLAQIVAQEAGMNTLANIAGNFAGSTLGATAAGIVLGRDPADALATSLAFGAGNALTTVVIDQIDVNTNGAFTKLREENPTAAKVVEASINSQFTGQDITSATVAAVIQGSGVATKLVNEVTKDYPDISNSQKAIAAQALTNVTTAAFLGKDPSAALQATLMKVGVKQLGDILSDEFNELVSKANVEQSKLDVATNSVNNNVKEQQAIVTAYNNLGTELQEKVDEQNRLLGLAQDARNAYEQNPNSATAAAANEAIGNFNNYVDQFTKEYGEIYKPQLDAYSDQLADLKTNYDGLYEDYEVVLADTRKTLQPLQDTYDTLYFNTTRAFVQEMDPTFNVDEYKEVNDLKNLTDNQAFEHWLTNGQYQGLKTNLETAQTDISAEKGRLLVDLADEKGVSISQLSDEDVRNFNDNITKTYGNNLAALRGASIQDYLTGNAITIDEALQKSNEEGFRIDVTGVAYGDWAKPPEGTFDLPVGAKYATSEEYRAGDALLLTTDDGKPVWISKTPVKQWDPLKGEFTELNDVTVTAKRSADLLEEDPLAWVYSAATLPDVDRTISDDLVSLAKKTINIAQATDNSTIINTAANAIKAGGGILRSFNGLVTFFDINPESTAAGELAKTLIDLGTASNTDEYKAALEKMNTNYAEAEGFTGMVDAIYTNLTEHPAEFLAEVIGVEGMQELVPLLVGGGAATFARGLALARGMGTTFANRVAVRTGIAAAGVSDIAESAGGTAANAFEEAYNLAVAKGMNESDAVRVGLDVAAKSGLVAGTITATTLGLGGNALEKVILGKEGSGKLASIINELGDRVREGGQVVIKEGVTEGIEEGLSQAYVEGQLYQLDPTRDVAANITASSILGAIAGGGIAGGAYTASTGKDIVSNIVVNSPQVNEAITTSTTPQDLTTKLNDLGITDTTTQTNILNTKFDADYTSTDEAAQAFASQPDFVAKPDDIKAVTGATPNTALPDAVNNYIDPLFVDRQEIIDAAAAEGITLTEDQINQYIGQKSEADTLEQAKTEFDPIGTTREEAKTFFEDEFGYTPTDTEIDQIIRENLPETDAKTAVEEYVGPRQVTREEALGFFEEAGYTPTEQEIQQYIQQGPEVSEEALRTQLEEFVDPRVVSQDEVIQAFENLGFKDVRPEDAASLIGQYEEQLLADRAAGKLDEFRYNALQQNINDIKESIGAPYRGVTEADIGSVQDILTTQQAEPTTTLTPEQLAYDTNQDGVIDQADLDFLQNVVRGTVDMPFVPAEGTVWRQEPTGIYATLAEQAAAGQAQAEELAKQTQQRQNVNTLLSMLGGAPDVAGQQVTVKAPDPLQLRYLYDISGPSIFATPQQEQMFVTPYAKGGAVEEDVTDALLRIIRG